MRSVLDGLEPALLWKNFDKLRRIPRCSKHEERAAEYVISVAERLGLDHERDQVGNVIIKKPATDSLENVPMVAIQSHLDMVCEKNRDSDHDFSKDPIEIGIENGYLRAKGTTLGADNGIGVSAALALLEDERAVHGPLELLFTVDEEEGMTGAYGLGEGSLESSMMINLDTDQVHSIYVGCAGGENSYLWVPVQREEVTFWGNCGGIGDEKDVGMCEEIDDEKEGWIIGDNAGRNDEDKSKRNYEDKSGQDDEDKSRRKDAQSGNEACCAGNADDFAALIVEMNGLSGGHSGVEIHLERGNTIKLLGRLLWDANREVPFRLVALKGGEKHNAIPREAEALICLPKETIERFMALVRAGEKALQHECKKQDPDLRVDIFPAKLTENPITEIDSKKVLDLIVALPTGIMKWSSDIEGLVESSINLSVIRTCNGDIFFLMSVRSSSDSQLRYLTDRVEAISRLADVEVEMGDAYPAWHPDLDSRLLQICKLAHKELFGHEPEVKSIHAGLETGIIKRTFPYMDAVSIGALIEQAHSPDERVSIESVEKMYKLPLKSLENVAIAPALK